MVGDNMILPAGGMLTQAPPSDDFNRYTQEMQSLIKEMDFFLTGEREARDENGNLVRERVEEPRVNVAGKNAILNWLRAYLNPNTYMSLTKSGDTFNNFILDSEDLADDMTVNHTKYGLFGDDMVAIHSKMCFMFFMALRKAETDKEYIYRNMKTNYAPTEPQQKKGLFGGLI
jgi:hypothetical protein